MGKWATYQRRGGGPGAVIALPVPVATQNGFGDLSWSVAGVVPTFAQVEVDVTLMGAWAIENTVAWTAFPYSVENPGANYRVVGINASSVPVTQNSNVINVP